MGYLLANWPWLATGICFIWFVFCFFTAGVDSKGNSLVLPMFFIWPVSYCILLIDKALSLVPRYSRHCRHIFWRILTGTVPGPFFSRREVNTVNLQTLLNDEEPGGPAGYAQIWWYSEFGIIWANGNGFDEYYLHPFKRQAWILCLSSDNHTDYCAFDIRDHYLPLKRGLKTEDKLIAFIKNNAHVRPIHRVIQEQAKLDAAMWNAKIFFHNGEYARVQTEPLPECSDSVTHISVRGENYLLQDDDTRPMRIDGSRIGQTPHFGWQSETVKEHEAELKSNKLSPFGIGDRVAPINGKQTQTPPHRPGNSESTNRETEPEYLRQMEKHKREDSVEVQSKRMDEELAQVRSEIEGAAVEQVKQMEDELAKREEELVRELRERDKELAQVRRQADEKYEDQEQRFEDEKKRLQEQMAEQEESGSILSTQLAEVQELLRQLQQEKVQTETTPAYESQPNEVQDDRDEYDRYRNLRY